MDNIFKKIREKAEERAVLRAKIRKQYNQKYDRKKDRENRIKDIKKLATEFYELMQDNKYPLYLKYLRGIQEEYRAILQESVLSDNSTQAKVAAANISMIDIIIDYPVAIIKEFEGKDEQA